MFLKKKIFILTGCFLFSGFGISTIGVARVFSKSEALNLKKFMPDACKKDPKLSNYWKSGLNAGMSGDRWVELPERFFTKQNRGYLEKKSACKGLKEKSKKRKCCKEGFNAGIYIYYTIFSKNKNSRCQKVFNKRKKDFCKYFKTKECVLSFLPKRNLACLIVAYQTARRDKKCAPSELQKSGIGYLESPNIPSLPPKYLEEGFLKKLNTIKSPRQNSSENNLTPVHTQRGR